MGETIGPSPHLKYHLQLKTKEDVGGGGCGLGLQRGGGQFTGRWKTWCLVKNVCWTCRDSGTQRGG